MCLYFPCKLCLLLPEKCDGKSSPQYEAIWKKERETSWYICMLLYRQKTPLSGSWQKLLQNRQSHSQTTLIQVLPVTLLVLPRCLRAVQPENVSPIHVIMSPFLWSSRRSLAVIYYPVQTRLQETAVASLTRLKHSRVIDYLIVAH